MESTGAGMAGESGWRVMSAQQHPRAQWTGQSIRLPYMGDDLPYPASLTDRVALQQYPLARALCFNLRD